MNPDTLGLLFNALSIAVALFALWTAGRIILRNLSFIQNKISTSRAIQLLIWLALGEIFILVLLDLLGLIQLVTSLYTDTTGEAYTLWGSVPSLVHNLSTVFTELLIYSATLMICWKPLFRRVPPILEAIQLNSYERVFSMLAIATLVNHVIRFIIDSIIWQQTPLEVEGLGKGISGFIAGWLVGLLLVAIIIYVMSGLIARQIDKMDEISD